MAISEAQLQTWTNAPSTTRHQITHNQIREALSRSQALAELNYEVYLQGSYANSTNIRNDSDVDVVVQLNSTYSPDISRLTPVERQVHQAFFIPAQYVWANFRQDVLTALIAYFGVSSVTVGTKCIKIAGNGTRVNADVMPAIQHRQYRHFAPNNQNDFVEGIKFWVPNGMGSEKDIVNYPKVHIENGERKNSSTRTDGKYKHIIRITKNIKRQLVEKHNFDTKRAPSYFIESTIYNVPDEHFQNGYQASLISIYDHILNRCTPANLLTASHQHILFGVEPWQWNTADAATFFQAAHQYYLNN